jgi:hypothetical protein
LVEGAVLLHEVHTQAIAARPDRAGRALESPRPPSYR